MGSPAKKAKARRRTRRLRLQGKAPHLFRPIARRGPEFHEPCSIARCGPEFDEPCSELAVRIVPRWAHYTLALGVHVDIETFMAYSALWLRVHVRGRWRSGQPCLPPA